MDKLLILHTYVDGGVNDTPFPNAENPIEVGAFRYDAKRMGGAPTITASVYYPSCLDDEWTENVYALFNGEKYYLKQTPTSSYNNSSAMYKHDIELVSERVALDNVYFFDVITSDPAESDKPVSNSTKVTFFGDVREFANRLQSSLEYSGLGYNVVVDTGVESEEKLVSFEDQFFSNVLQEIYNTYELPYYIDEKTIHIGYSKVAENLPTFAYGVDDALLSITKNNANYKIVNRATATGSSDNIPFYYPNNSPKGNIEARTNRSGITATILDYEKYSNEVKLDQAVNYVVTSVSISSFKGSDGRTVPTSGYAKTVECDYTGLTDEYAISINANKESSVKLTINPFAGLAKVNDDGSMTEGAIPTYSMRLFANGKQVGNTIEGSDTNRTFDFKVSAGTTSYTLYIKYSFAYTPKKIFGQVGLTSYSMNNDSTSGWYLGNKEIELSKLGIKVNGTPQNGDTITQKLIEYIKTSDVLMPYKYRETKAEERFYNATNGTYEGITFNNPYFEGKPKEHIFKVEDIKPSIEGMEVGGQRIDMFADFAYDDGDNDETYEDEEGNVYYQHPYFFAKLKPLGFNLFDHAIEQQPMTISFTSGNCGACNFEIAVDEETQKNTVQVDANGNVKRDSNGRVLCGAEGSGQDDVQPQPEQQDTTSRSVWIALRKEDATYGILMPKAPVNGKGGHRPSTSDKFVILGIKLPSAYIVNAEKRLEAEIINYLKNNNDEKFTFSINFSRIYFAENAEVLNNLSENSKVTIVYDDKEYELYVSSFSYTMNEGDALPEIRIELDETLKTSQNALQNAINEIKSTLGNAINLVSQEASRSQRSFVSKVENDIAMGEINFSKGIKFGEGGKVEVLDNNSAKLTIEYLEVTKKATFTSLEIQEKTHVGGQILVTPASMNCGEVEEFEDFYRCYFQTKGAEGGEEIFNQFAEGDQAICQTFNTWGSRYYWRLVVGVGEDYIDLSKADCDEGSGVPEAGDKIIQMGNRVDANRQNAIVIAAYGDNSPYIVQYKGISNYDLPKNDDDPRITTLLSPTKNILTGQVRMTAGSSGLELFDEWEAKQQLIDSKASGEDFETFKSLVDKDIENIQKQVDGAITTWFYDPTPTLENIPAVDWTTDDDKNNHLGDLYYSGEGKAYRFQYDEATTAYYWNLIEDEDITEALGLAQQAKDTADGKRRVFVVQPTPPYDEGDLWSRGSTLPMMICVNTKTSGIFAEGDWDFADNAGQLAEQIAGYEYIKEAIQNGSTIVTGGLIQSGVLMLGYNDADGKYHVMSGTNGIYDANATGGGIAAWYGGAMSEDSAKTVLRFDGSGFFANKNITWDNEGGASFANGKLTITPQGALVLGNEINFGGADGDTVQNIISKLSEIMSWFSLDESKTTLTTRYNLVMEQDAASGGEGEVVINTGVTSIILNGVEYNDDDHDGVIDLGTVSGGEGGGIDVTQLEAYLTSNNYINSVNGIISMLGYTPANNASLGGFAYKNSLDITDIPDLSSLYLATSLLGDNTLIHSGNIGSYAVLAGKWYDNGVEPARNSTGILNGVGAFINVGYNSDFWFRFYVDGDGLQFSSNRSGTKLTGKTIAFTDSNFKLGLGHSITDSNDRSALSISADNQINIGYGTAGANFNTNIHGASIILKYGTSRSWGMVMNTSGNVTIGASDLAGTSWKAYINGSTRIANITITSSVLNANRNVNTGALLDSSKMGFEIEPFASYVALKGYNTSGTGVGGVNIASSGNVLIGTTTDSGTKLRVDGKVLVNRFGAEEYTGGADIIINKAGTYYIGMGVSIADKAKFAIGRLATVTGAWVSEDIILADNGAVTMSNELFLGNNMGIYFKNASGTNVLAMYVSPSNVLQVGYNNVDSVAFQKPVTMSSTLSVAGDAIVNGEVASGGTSGSGGGGGAISALLNSWSEYNASTMGGYALSAALGYDLYTSKLDKSGGTISGTTTDPIIVNTSAESVGIRLQINKANKAYVGYGSSVGAYLYNYDTGAYIGVDTSGSPFYHNGTIKNTLYHTGNFNPANYLPKSGGGTVDGNVAINGNLQVSVVGSSNTSGKISAYTFSGYQVSVTMVDTIFLSLKAGALQQPLYINFYEDDDSRRGRISIGAGGVLKYSIGTGTENNIYHAGIIDTIKTDLGLGSLAYKSSLGKADVGLGNVENTALSTWAGTNKITTLGTITSGTWNGSKITNTYLANSAITIAGTSVSLGGSISASTITTAQIGSGNTLVHSGNIGSQTVSAANKLVSSGVDYITYNSTYDQVWVNGINIGYGGNTIETSSGGALDIQKNSTGNTRINTYGGNVLIGTTTDRSKKLQIDTSTWDGGLLINRTIASAGACVVFSSQGTVLGRIGVNGSKYAELAGADSTYFWTDVTSGKTTIGYNTAQSTYMLDLGGSMRLKGSTAAAMTAGAGALIVMDSSGAMLMFDSNDIQAKTSNGVTANTLYINDWGGSVILCGQNKGNVGIGVTSTSYKLDVNGNTRISGNLVVTGDVASA